jgi:hypothetical protein
MLSITNQTRQLLIVTKNSGSSVYLGSGEAAEMPRTEIDGNAKIEKLVRTGALSIDEAAPRSAPEAAAQASSEEESPRSRKARLQKR